MREFIAIFKELLHSAQSALARVFHWRRGLSPQDMEQIQQQRMAANLNRIMLSNVLLILFQTMNLAVDLLTKAHGSYGIYFNIGALCIIAVCLLATHWVLVILRDKSAQGVYRRSKRWFILLYYFLISILILGFSVVDLIERNSLNNFWALVVYLGVFPVLEAREAAPLFGLSLSFQLVVLLLAHAPANHLQQCVMLMMSAFVVNQVFFSSFLSTQLSRIQLEAVSHVDYLTDVLNRRGMSNWMETHKEDLRGRQVACGFIDIDYFKVYNDAYGHLEGDDCLKKISDMVKAFFAKEETMICRYGGEEILVILPGLDYVQAGRRFDALRAAIRKADIPFQASPLLDSVTVSIGYATQSVFEPGELRDLIRRADDALYTAKKGGRNRVEGYVRQEMAS